MTFLKHRRSEDHPLRLVIGESDPPPESRERADGDPLQWSLYEWGTESTPRLIELSDLRPENDGRVLVLDFGGDSAVLSAGASIRRIPSGASRADLLERASRGAAAWEAERGRLWRWLRLPDLLHQFAERLNGAAEIAEVSRAVTRGVVEIVGGYHATLLLREPPVGSMFAASTRLRAIEGEPLSIPTHPRLWRPGLVRVSEAQADVGGPFARLSQWLTDAEEGTLVHVPVGEEGVILLSERRSGRTFDGDDWSLLRNLASQAEGAIRRVRSLEEVKLLSLTDPLTGLANRRRLEIVCSTRGPLPSGAGASPSC